jgi:hypothetical protein
MSDEANADLSARRDREALRERIAFVVRHTPHWLNALDNAQHEALALEAAGLSHDAIERRLFDLERFTRADMMRAANEYLDTGQKMPTGLHALVSAHLLATDRAEERARPAAAAKIREADSFSSSTTRDALLRAGWNQEDLE